MHKYSLQELLQLAHSRSFSKSKRKAYFGHKYDMEKVYAAKVDNHLLVISHIYKRITPKKRDGVDPYWTKPHIFERCMISYAGTKYTENFLLTLEGKVKTGTTTSEIRKLLHSSTKIRYQSLPESSTFRQVALQPASLST